METKDLPLNMPCSDPEGCKHFKNEIKLQERIIELEDVLAELYTKVSYEKSGEWVIDDRDL